jgi:hypothetical protein
MCTMYYTTCVTSQSSQPTSGLLLAPLPHPPRPLLHTCSSAVRAGSMSRVWKAPLTASSTALTAPASIAALRTTSKASRCPDTTRPCGRDKE